MRYFLALTAAAFIAAPAMAAVAIGDTVTCAVTGGGTFLCNTPSATVGSGPEFWIGNSPADPHISADFSTDLLTIEAVRDTALGSTILNFTVSPNPFSTVNLVSADWAGVFDFAADVAISGGTLSIDLRNSGVNISQGSSIVLSFGVVPEPTTWAMLIAGFGLVGTALRRRRAAIA